MHVCPLQEHGEFLYVFLAGTRPEHQGQGLATEAARAVLALAGKAGLDQVLAITDLDNAASQRVAARLGMADEGVTERWFGLTARQYRKVMSLSES